MSAEPTSATVVGSPGVEPLYIRTAAAIRERIVQDGYELGVAIEPESVLVRELGVSRVTLRRAIDILVDEQLLVRRQGVGTFVVPWRITYPLIGLHSTRDLARAHGIELRVEIVNRVVEKATPHERSRLQLRRGEDVLRYLRCDVDECGPVAVARCTLPARYAECLEEGALRLHSSYELIERFHGLRVTRASQVMRSEPASPHVGSLLGLRAGQPVFVVERLTFERGGFPVEWAVLSYRHDRVECSVELEREPAGRRESATDLILRFPVRAGAGPRSAPQ
jgi:GntR family transcriptional regulator